MSEKVALNISKEIYDKAREFVERNKDAFSSVEEFVEHVLREFLSEEEEEVFTPEEEEEIKRRLRDLGYL
ncbi:MAG TPA: CopG family transcriptional regulator [Thermofilum sp.]|nr:CopG family transcriptional regulator [Thermofilum sp.]